MFSRSIRNIAAAAVLAGTALAAIAIAPTTASAHGHGWGGHGWGHGWGHHWGHHWGYGHWGYYGGCSPRRYVNAYGEVVIVPGCYD